MEYIVERIAIDTVILEAPDRSHLSVSIALLPCGIKEGDLVLYDEADGYRIDEKKTEERRLMMAEKQRKLFGN